MSPARRLTLVLAGSVLGAAGLWTAGRLVWFRTGWTGGLRGAVEVPVTGSTVRPELSAAALVALAAAAAVVATSGWPRRIVGVVVAAAGVWVMWLSVTGWTLAPSTTGAPSDLPGLVPPSWDAVPAGPPARTAAPLLAVLAGMVLLAVGAGIARWARVLPGLGRRFDGPGTTRPPPDRDTGWWSAMDAGRDPTATGPPADPAARG